MKILHVITGLHTGGAETMLSRLLTSPYCKPEEHRVVCLGTSGPIGEKIKAQGFIVDVLGGKGRLSALRVVIAAVRIAKAYRPDIIQGWMYDGNLAAWWMAKRCGARLIWNVRYSIADISREPFDLRIVIRVCAWLSSKVDVILYNSHIAAKQHNALGFSAGDNRVLPNGFNTSVFKPDPDARMRVRKGLGIPENGLLVGMIARYHPMKDHLNFIKAAGKVARSVPEVCFLLAGYSVEKENRVLLHAVSEAGIQSKTFLLGERQDTPALNAALDVAVSSSAWGEGFSNVLGEAMACEVPCVATDVGDAVQLLRETGTVVPPKNSDALSGALIRLLNDHEYRSALGNAARKRIEENYSLEVVANQYLQLWEGII